MGTRRHQRPEGLAARSPADPFDAGPFARLLASADPERARRRMAAIVLVAWVPLLLLASVQGLALGATPRESFLLDLSAHVRYLVALPILVGTAPWSLLRLAAIVRHFEAAGLIEEGQRPRLDDLLVAARRLLDHRGVEVLLVALAYATTLVAAGGALYSSGTPTWVSPDPAGGLSLAGWWRALVSQPLVLLFGGVWLWRVVVWARVLWGVSRLDLRIVPAHPDLSGGLRFVAESMRAYIPVAFALGTVVAGTFAEEILLARRPPNDFQYIAGTLTFGVVCLFAGPLLAFVGPLRIARIRGVFEYGALASSLGLRFEERWLRPGPQLDAGALGVPDFSATIDLYSVAGNVRRMSIMPFGLRELVPLVVATLLPFVPLVLAFVPVGEVLKRVLGGVP